MSKDNPETDLVTIKPATASHVTELFSQVLLPSCSPPGRPFPIKSLALSAHVSPQTIHFRVLDKSPISGLEGVHLPATILVTISDMINIISKNLMERDFHGDPVVKTLQRVQV